MQAIDERTRLLSKIAEELEAMHAACKPLIQEVTIIKAMSIPKMTLSVSGSLLDVELEPLPEGFRELIDSIQGPFIERIKGLNEQLARAYKP